MRFWHQEMWGGWREVAAGPLDERCLRFKELVRNGPQGMMQAEGQEPVERQAEAGVWPCGGRESQDLTSSPAMLGLRGHEAQSRSSGSEGGTYSPGLSGDTHENQLTVGDKNGNGSQGIQGLLVPLV